MEKEYKLVKSKKRTVRYRTDVYQITKVVQLKCEYTNDRLTSSELVYTGKKLDWRYWSTLFNKRERDTVTPVLVKDEFFDCIKKHYAFGENYLDGRKIHPLIDFAVREFYDDKGAPSPISPKYINPKNIVFAYYNGHILFDSNEEILPTIFNADYINGSFDNERYDLPKLVNVLKKKSEVIKISEITDVPYYNNDDGNRKYISFTLLPNKKKLQAVYQRVVRKSPESWSTRLKDELFSRTWADSDYLGIKKCQVKGT